MSITSILNIAKNAIGATQTSLQVVSHNIANVNTDGYARQEAVLDEEEPSPIGGVYLGNGVKVKSIIRYYDKYLDNQIASKNTGLEEQKVYQKYYERIESILNEDTSKLTNNITSFFNSWQELSLDPQSVATRESVFTSAEKLADSIKNIYNGLKDVQIELNDNVKSEVADINRIVSSIAELNSQIFEGTSASSEANDYINKRSEYIKELSGKIDITFFEDNFGRVTVLTAKGKVLVDNESYWELDTTMNVSTGYWDVGWKDASGQITNITDDLVAGELKGLIEMRDNNIDEFVNDIDTLAQVLITEVNNIHRNGYTLNHVPVGPPDAPDDIPFFKVLAGTYAKDIDLSDEVKADVKNIAASSEVDAITGEPLGNGTALGISSLVNSYLYNGGNSTITDYSSSIVNRIGEYTRGANDSAEFAQDTMDVLNKQRESISGVSLDDEMSNLIKFQYAFQAASRLFNVADELFQSILQAVS